MRRHRCRTPGTLLVALALGLPLLATAAEDRFAAVEITGARVAAICGCCRAPAATSACSSRRKGTLMVDDQYAPLAERIEAKIDEIAGVAPRFVLNTHFHGDHTGGNPFFGRSGTIVAHENVRTRLVAGAMAAQGLPVVTYADRVRLHLGGETVDVLHAPSGHTDGDSYVFFRATNVVHLGDQFFNGRFPYVDLQSGGSVAGLIANIGDAWRRSTRKRGSFPPRPAGESGGPARLPRHAEHDPRHRRRRRRQRHVRCGDPRPRPR